MKYFSIKAGGVIMAVTVSVIACKKTPDVGIQNLGNFTETATALKDAADFPLGAAVSYTPFTTDNTYSSTAKRDFDAVTFEYQMKHGAVVQDNGSFNFTNTDALVSAVGTMDIFGHTLNWHANNNATYLKNYSGITVPSAIENLGNAGFEQGLTGWSVFNSGNPSGSATITTTTVASEIHGGTTGMKVINPTAYPGNQWRVQVASILVNTTPGTQYTFSYWVKAVSAGGSIRLSTQDQAGGNAQYQGDQTIGTTFAQISWTITANSAQTRFLFDMGQAANTYFIDDASFKQVIIPPGGAAIALKLDTAMNTFITTMVNRYKNKVKAWDVVNEPFADNPVAIRNNTNTSTTPSDVLVWANYMGRGWALKAFNYAKAADPTADLYINDYNLESNSVKLDSLIAFVNELKTAGAKVDGIGTQMHVSRNTSYAGIDAMMKKLAATGLKIRISELDVKAVAGSAAGKLTPELASFQAVMYKYIVASYMKYIPKAQQAGITVWGVNDKNSWLYNNGTEFPLLYDVDYNKKQAYAGFLQALKGQ
jgi:endo-1,4-beta-xylanase